jgi:pectate lyase
MSILACPKKAPIMATETLTRRGVVLLLLPVIMGSATSGDSQSSLDLEQWTAKIHGGWVGKVAAGSGALPTEMWPKDRIQEQFGILASPPQKPTSRGPLDDTTLALLGWHTAREHGSDFSTAQIAQQWIDHLTAADLQGGGFGSEFLDALARLRRGERPPIRSSSPRAEWIAGQMRAEIWGMLAPGDPTRAADYAARDARLFNTGNGVYAAQFVAALASQLMVDADLDRAIAVARQQVPPESALARLTDDVIRWHQENPNDWEKTWQLFVDAYRDRSLEKQFAAWSSDWLVETGGWPEAEVLAEYLDRKHVLRSHPFSEDEPACLTTELAVPQGGANLMFAVTCNDHPAHVDWLLRVRIGDEVQERPIRWIDGKPQWQEFTFDLKRWAGQRVTIVLENAVLGKFGWEAGFWTAPELRDSQGKPLRGERPAGQLYRYPLEFTPKILPETFSVLVGLLYGEGDFRKSVSLTTMCGFDTDCNAGTVGCLLGLRNGIEAIPAEWKNPLGDTYELQVTGLPRQWKIPELAREMARTGTALSRGERPLDTKDASRPIPAKTVSVVVAKVPTPVDRPEGFGAASKGGEGGRVIVVTSLADSGPGSLREALAVKGPRIILFAIEGTIKLESRLRCTSGQVTIDGGSAPGQGITLSRHGFEFRGDCDDIIVRNLRIRVLTGGAEGDCLQFWGNQGGTVDRVLIDHCSLMWATDEVVNTWGNVRDLTCQWTIIAEAQLPHSKAWLSGVGSDRISIHHCLFAHNADRVPKLEGGVYHVVNNVLYNWGNNNAAKIEEGARVDFINNCFLAGADSAPKDGFAFPADLDKGTKVYLSGNIGPYSRTGAEDQWANVTSYERAGSRWVEHRPAPDGFCASQPLANGSVTTQAAQQAYELVLARAGAKVRDADDLRVIRDVRERTGRAGRELVVVPIPAKPRTGKFTLMALGDNNLSDFEPLVERYDLLIASHSVGADVIGAFRQRNPGALVFCYLNTSDVNAGWISDPYYARIWNDTNPHEDWFHHDSQGQRVRIYYPKYKERCAFNTGNPGLQQYLAHRVVETLQSGLYDGIQLDNVSTEFPFFEKLVGKWISAVPVNLTPEQWTADEVAMLKVIMQAAADAGFENKTIIFNHMRSGEPAESRAYLECTDGANCESWISRGVELNRRWGWKAKVDQVWEANHLGKLTNLLCVPSTESEQEALFCYASYLMALEGDRSFFFYAPGYKMSVQHIRYPFYDLDLGEPSAVYEARGGGFWRRFAKGAVAMNPTNQPTTISLPGRYRDRTGEEVKTLSLGPKQAAILLLPE